jgi:hypothetical protein
MHWVSPASTVGIVRTHLLMGQQNDFSDDFSFRRTQKQQI